MATCLEPVAPNN